MSPFSQSITFHPVTETELPILRKWLSAPHVQKWWGDPVHEISLMRQVIAHPFEQGFIASIESCDFGYIQKWRPSEYLDEAPWAADLPNSIIGIDTFIGDVSMLGKGLGSAMVHAFCAMLFTSDAQRLVIDPDARNTIAVKTYGKAGFKHLMDYTTSTGITHVMDLTKSRFQRTL